MALLTSTAVLDRVSALLQDPFVRWPLAERLLYLSDGQREVCIYKPDACVKTVTHSLVTGTEQRLPADGVSLLRVVGNMGVTGTVPGRVPRSVPHDLLDAENPGWHTAPASPEVRHYVYDDWDKKRFFVSPPQPGSGCGTLRLRYVAAPEAVTDGATLVLDDTWLPALLNYVLYRCYGKDAEGAANAELATAYYQAFLALVSGRDSSEKGAEAEAEGKNA